MIRALAMGLAGAALVSCGAAQKPACSDDAIAATRVLHEQAARGIVEAGECDRYDEMADCPAYQEIQRSFDLASTLWEHCE